MLYFIRNDKQEYRWHLGEAKFVPPSEVLEVQADGDELEWILQNITGLLVCKSARVQTWYGDTAKFIAGCIF